MILLALVACADLFINPEEGTYEVDVRSLESNSACDDWGADVDALRDIDHTDVELSKDGETMELDDAVECDLFGTEFNCFLETEEPITGYDATLVTRHEIEGTWTSSTSFEADWEMSLDCEGSECNSELDTCRITFGWDGELD